MPAIETKPFDDLPIDALIGDKKASLTALGARGGEFSDASFGRTGKLLRGGVLGSEWEEEKKCGQTGVAKRGEIPGMEVTIHAVEVAREIS